MAIDTVPKDRLTRYKNAKHVMIFILGLALLLEIAAFCTPGWVVTSRDVAGVEHSMQRGLWYFITCKDERCDTKSFTDIEDYTYYQLHDDGLLEYQVECCLAIFCVIVAFFCVVSTCREACDHFKKRLCMTAMAVTALVSSAMALLAVGRIADATIKEEDRLGDHGPFEAPYSVILMGVAGILCFVVFMMYVCIMCYCRPVGSRGKKYVEKRVITNQRNMVPYTVPGPPQEKVFITEKRVIDPYPIPPQEKIIVTERHHQAPSVDHSYRSYHNYDRASVVQGEDHYDVIRREPYHVKMEFVSRDEARTYSTAGSKAYSTSGSTIVYPTTGGSKTYSTEGSYRIY